MLLAGCKVAPTPMPPTSPLSGAHGPGRSTPCPYSLAPGLHWLPPACTWPPAAVPAPGSWRPSPGPAAGSPPRPRPADAVRDGQRNRIREGTCYAAVLEAVMTSLVLRPSLACSTLFACSPSSLCLSSASAWEMRSSSSSRCNSVRFARWMNSDSLYLDRSTFSSEVQDLSLKIIILVIPDRVPAPCHDEC